MPEQQKIFNGENSLIRQKAFLLQWHITERCNWRCRHCYQDWNKMPPDLSLKQLFKIFDKFLFLIQKQNIPSQRVTLNITGGEPLVRKDFFQLVERIGQHSHLFRWGLMSNGSLLNKDNILELKKAGIWRCQVSLEGMEKNNDKIRGKGSFKKTIRAMKLLANAGISVRVSLTLTRENMKDIPVLVKLCNKLGASALGTRRLIPWGQGKELAKYMLQPQELRNFYLKVKKINAKLAKGKSELKVILGCESGIFSDELIFDTVANMNANFCGVTQGRGLTIMANGDILPCRRLPIVVGNALREDLESVYNSPKMRELRNLDKLHPFCQKCPNFLNCFGGAKCINYTYTGKLNVPDIQCWRAYKKIDQPRFAPVGRNSNR